MKIKSLFAAVIASAMAFVACEQEKIDLGTPSIALSLEEVTLEAAGGEATVYSDSCGSLVSTQQLV